MSDLKNILVIQTAFIGDAILATAVLEKLHEFHPRAKLFFLVRNGNEQLFSGHPFLTEVLVWDKTHKYSSLLKTLQRIRREKFDLVVNLHRHASSGLLTVLSGAKTTVGFNKNPLSFLFTQTAKHIIGDGYHETGRNQLLISAFTDDNAARPKIYPLPQHDEKVKKYKTRDYVCMAPASVWFTKQWPEQKWAELCHLIRSKKIYLLGGPGDRVLCSRIIAASDNDEVVSLAGELSFLESASLMRDAKMNYVNDSGPLHIASAVNAPVTAIYCSTVPEFGFYPLSEKSKIVQVEEELECRPCGLHGFKNCPQGHFKCGFGISINEVV